MSIPFASVFAAAARRAGIERAILLAVAHQESGFNPGAVNHDSNGTEDVGIMQLNLQAQQLSYSYAANPVTAIPYAAHLLASLKRRYGTWARALSAYNSGSPTGSPAYAAAVLAQARQYGYTGAEAGAPAGSAAAGPAGTGASAVAGLPLPALRWGLVAVGVLLFLVALTRL